MCWKSGDDEAVFRQGLMKMSYEPTESIRKDRRNMQLFGGHVEEEVAYEFNVLLAMEAMTKTDGSHGVGCWYRLSRTPVTQGGYHGRGGV